MHSYFALSSTNTYKREQFICIIISWPLTFPITMTPLLLFEYTLLQTVERIVIGLILFGKNKAFYNIPSFCIVLHSLSKST